MSDFEIKNLPNGDFKVVNDTVQSSIKLMSPNIGMTSLIGVYGDAPHAWGNYFGLIEGNLRIVNFWAENLSAAKKFLTDGKVKVRVYKDGQLEFGIIEDERIPSDWYYNKLCFTGGYTPSLDILKDMYSRLGDPDNELEKYTDPVSYYVKRGYKYNEKNGYYSLTKIDKS